MQRWHARMTQHAASLLTRTGFVGTHRLSSAAVICIVLHAAAATISTLHNHAKMNAYYSVGCELRSCMSWLPDRAEAK